MKKIIIFLVVVCLLTLTACGGGSKQQPSHPQETRPIATTTPVVNEKVVEEQVAEDVKIVIEAALDYINENEDIDGATKFSNAILSETSYEIIFADKDKCEIVFKYPDAEAFLLKASEFLNDDSTEEEEIDAVLAQMADEIIKADTRITKTVTVEIDENNNGDYTIVWNDDLYNAVSGGLHSMQVKEG